MGVKDDSGVISQCDLRFLLGVDMVWNLARVGNPDTYHPSLNDSAVQNLVSPFSFLIDQAAFQKVLHPLVGLHRNFPCAHLDIGQQLDHLDHAGFRYVREIGVDGECVLGILKTLYQLANPHFLHLPGRHDVRAP